jgi:hypothetical protein
MRVSLAVLAGAAALALSAGTAAAHHSFAAEYDANKPVTLKGTVSKVEWMNPHARFYVDVRDEKGNVTSWNLELASPNVLVRNGDAQVPECRRRGRRPGLGGEGRIKMANARVVKRRRPARVCRIVWWRRAPAGRSSGGRRDATSLSASSVDLFSC